MKKECRECHLPMTEKIGNFEHVAFDNRVTLCDVPYWSCEGCGHQFYADARKVEERIVQAIIDKQTEIPYM